VAVGGRANGKVSEMSRMMMMTILMMMIRMILLEAWLLAGA